MVKRAIVGTEFKEYEKEIDSFAKGLVSQLVRAIDKEIDKTDMQEIFAQGFDFDQAIEKSIGMPQQRQLYKSAKQIINSFDRAVKKASKENKRPISLDLPIDVKASGSKLSDLAKKYGLSDKYKADKKGLTDQLQVISTLDKHIADLRNLTKAEDVDKLISKIRNSDRLKIDSDEMGKAFHALLKVQEIVKSFQSLEEIDGVNFSKRTFAIKEGWANRLVDLQQSIYSVFENNFSSRLGGDDLSSNVIKNAGKHLSEDISKFFNQMVEEFEIERMANQYGYSHGLSRAKTFSRANLYGREGLRKKIEAQNPNTKFSYQELLTQYIDDRIRDAQSNYNYAELIADYIYTKEGLIPGAKSAMGEETWKKLEGAIQDFMSGESGTAYTKMFESITQRIQSKQKELQEVETEVNSIYDQIENSFGDKDESGKLIKDNKFARNAFKKIVSELFKELTPGLIEGTISSEDAIKTLRESVNEDVKAEVRKNAKARQQHDSEMKRLRKAENQVSEEETTNIPKTPSSESISEDVQDLTQDLKEQADALNDVKENADAARQSLQELDRQEAISGDSGISSGSGEAGSSVGGSSPTSPNTPPSPLNPPIPPNNPSSPTPWDELIRIVERMENGVVVGRDEWRRITDGFIEQRHFEVERDDQGNVIGGLQEQWRRNDTNFDQIDKIYEQFNLGQQKLLRDLEKRQLELDKFIVNLTKNKAIDPNTMDRLSRLQDLLSGISTDVVDGTISSSKHVRAAESMLDVFDSDLASFKDSSVYLPDSDYVQINNAIQETIRLHKDLTKARKQLEKHPGEKKYLDRVHDIETTLRNTVYLVEQLRMNSGTDLFADVANSPLFSSSEKQSFAGKVSKYNQATGVFGEHFYSELKSLVRSEFSIIGQFASNAFLDGFDYDQIKNDFDTLWQTIETKIASDPKIFSFSSLVDQSFGQGTAASAITSELKAVKEDILPDVNKLFTQVNNKVKKFSDVLVDQNQFGKVHDLITDLVDKVESNSFDDKNSILAFITILKQLSSLDKVLGNGAGLDKVFGVDTSTKIDLYSNKVNVIKSGLGELIDLIIAGDLDKAKLKYQDFFNVLDECVSNADAYEKVNSKGTLENINQIHTTDDLTNALRAYALQQNYSNEVSKEASVDGKTVTAIYQKQNGELVKLTGTMQEAVHGMRLMGQVQKQNVGWGNAFRGAINDSVKSMINMTFRSISLWEVLQKAREGLEVFKAYDDTLTNMSYTMDATADELDSLGQACIDLANDLSISLENAESIYAIYANMQTTAEEIAAQATPTAILSNISEVDTSTAADQIQGILQQFNMLEGAEEDIAKASMHVVDVLNEISANVAIDNVKAIGIMSDAVTAAGQVAFDAGLSFEQLSAITAKVAERTREDGGTIGNAIKTIVTRISKVGKMPGYEDEVDNETLSNASKSLKEVGIAVYNADGSFRELDVILTELRAKWDGLTDAQQANISYNVAATRQTSKFKNILEAWSESMSLATQATYSSGGALENQEKYLESVSGKLQKIGTQWDTLWVTLYNNDGTKKILDFVSGFISLLQDLVETLGTLGTVGGIGGLILGSRTISKKLESQGLDVWKWFGQKKDKYSNIADGKKLMEPLIKNFAEASEKKKNNPFDIATLMDYDNALGSVSKSWESLDYATKKAIYTNEKTDKSFVNLAKNMFKFDAKLDDTTKKTTTWTGAFKGLLGSITSTHWAIAGLTAAVLVGIAVYKAHQKSLEDAKNTAKETAEALNTNVSSMESYIETYNKLHTALVNAAGDESEVYSIKQQLLTLQNSINESFGDEYEKVNLVTGAYQDQIRVLENYQNVATSKWYNENTKGIREAKKEMNTSTRSVSTNGSGAMDVRYGNSDVRDLLEKYNQKGLTWSTSSGVTKLSITAEAEDAEKIINSLMNDLRELKSYAENPDAFKALEDSLSKLLKNISADISQNKETFYKALTYEVAGSDLSDEYAQFLSLSEEYQDALASATNPYTDENVQWYAQQLSKLYHESFEQSDFKQLIEKNIADLGIAPQQFYANNKDYLADLFNQGLFGNMNNLDFEGGAKDGVTNWLDELVNKAEEVNVLLPELIALLIELGYIQGQPVEDNPIPEKTYIERISQIEALHEGLDQLGEIYKDVKNSQDFDWASMLNNDEFKKEFGDLTSASDEYKTAYEDFVYIISKSPNDIEACQEAFDNLATAYVNDSGALKDLNEDTKEATIAMLEQMGIVNAEVAVTEYLNRLLAQQAIEKRLLEENPIDTFEEVQEIYNLAQAAGASAEALAGLKWAMEVLSFAEPNTESYENALKVIAKYTENIAELQLKQGLDFSLVDFDPFAGETGEAQYAELFDFFERRIEVIQQALDLLDASLENVFGADAKNQLISQQSEILKRQLGEYAQAEKMYEEAANHYLSRLDSATQEKIKNGSLDVTALIGDDGEAINENLEGYVEWANKAADCKQQIAELKEELRDLELEKFNNIIEDFTNQFDLFGESIDLIEQQIGFLESAGQIIPESFYTTQIEQTQKQLSTLEAQKSALITQLQSSLASGLIEAGTDEWLEMVQAIGDVESSILDSKTALEDLDTALRQLHWDMFDRIQDQFDQISDEAGNMIELLNDSTDIQVSDGHGNWTDEAITAMGLYAQQYETALYQVQEYEQAIAELTQQFNNGEITTTEYLEKLGELNQGKWEAVQAAEAVEDAIISLNETRVNEEIEVIQEEIEAYKELTDAQIESLDAQKDLHDYQKSIAESSKNIADIQRQLAALEYDDSAAARAKKAQLEEQLAEAKEEREELEYEHSIESQKEALTKQAEDYEETRNEEIERLEESLKNREYLISQSFETVKQNADMVGAIIERTANEHGITISKSLTDAWKAGSNAISSYGTVLSSQSSAFIITLQGVETEMWDLQDQAEKTYGAIATTFAAQADGLVLELQESWTAADNLREMAKALNDSFVSALSGSYDVSGIVDALKKIEDAAKSAAAAVDGLNSNNTGVYVEGHGSGAGNHIMHNTNGVNKNLAALYSYAKGGLVTKDDNNPLNNIAKAVGEDSIIAAKEGEGILTPIQTEAMIKLAPFLDKLNNNFSAISSFGSFKSSPIVDSAKSIGNSIQVGSLVTVNGNVDDNNLKKITDIVKKEINTQFTKWNRDFVYSGY